MQNLYLSIILPIMFHPYIKHVTRYQLSKCIIKILSHLYNCEFSLCTIIKHELTSKTSSCPFVLESLSSVDKFPIVTESYTRPPMKL